MYQKRLLLLFDIDGTLTEPMQSITPEMKTFMETLSRIPHVDIGIVGGSDSEKAMHQLGSDYRKVFKHCFHENGCVYFRDDDLVHEERLEDFLGQDKLNKLLSYILQLLGEAEVPCRTGTFIERRKCMLNVSPVGRACSQSQREEFFAYDKLHHTREVMVQRIWNRFPDLDVEIAIGGMISIDIFPKGLNKTHALSFLPIAGDSDVEIHFFGDRTLPGGNDHEIYNSPRVIGHAVVSPDDTRRQVEEVLGLTS
jgi:phosphomannomutase